MNFVPKENLIVVYNKRSDPESGYDTWQPSLLKLAKQNEVAIISIEELYNLVK